MMTENNENMNIVELNDAELEDITGGKTTLVATRDEANIRSGPGTSSPVIGHTVRGKSATYLGEKVTRNGRTWLKVSFHGKTGWICSDYVKVKK